MRKYIYYILALVSACGLAACSTTEKLAEGEVLYTGVKKLKVVYSQEQPIRPVSSVHG